MARNLNDLVGAEDAGYVGPLLANDRFRKGADSQLAANADAEDRAAKAASAHEDFAATIRMFASVKRGLAAIAKRFPESAKHTDESAKQMDMAMQCVVGDDPNAPAASRGPAPSPFLSAQRPASGTPSPLPPSQPGRRLEIR
jgi:hypothetical protein